MKFMKDEELVERYKGAVAIYALQRKKKLTKKEKIFDWAVALFSPLPSIVDEADHVADMGAYFLVHKDDEEILVRVQGEEIFEETVTDKLDKKSEKVFVYDGNQSDPRTVIIQLIENIYLNKKIF